MTAENHGDAAAKITGRIHELGGWRGATLAKMRALIHAADPEVVEAWKWMGTPVWEHDGILCTGETYKQVVKLTFARGAALKDPKKLFNSSLEGNVRRALDIREGEMVDETAFKELIRAAVDANTAALAARTAKQKSPKQPARKAAQKAVKGVARKKSGRRKPASNAAKRPAKKATKKK